jgi:hypothetical protein
MKQGALLLVMTLVIAWLAIGTAVAQEKAPAPTQEPVKAKEPAPAAVPAEKQAGEPRSLGVPIDAPTRSNEVGSLKVEEAVLGTGVEDRMIVGEAKEFMLNEKVYLWLKVAGGPAEDLTVTWKSGGMSYDTKLNIGGSPWRTWAYKTAAFTGAWTVTVTDASGKLLQELTFTVKEGALKAKE